MTDETVLEPGDRIHGYVVERLAAVGGSALVYEARDPVLGRTVAIKVLRRAAGPGEWGWRQLEREGRRSVRLEHPAFVTVHEVFPYEGGSALVMEWVDGMTLAERLAQGPLSFNEIRSAFLDLAGALGAAHRSGRVHGDLSPANLMIRPDGRVKVLDPAPVAPATTETPVAVSRSYAAPEILAGGIPSPASDVYAFGAMLDEALRNARRSRGAGGRSADLFRLARRCLETNPDRRPPDGDSLERMLRRRVPGRAALLRAGAVGATAAVLVTLVLGWGALRWIDGRGSRTGAVWSGMERLQIEGSLPVLLQDGSAIFYRTEDDRGIAELPLGSGRPRTVWHGHTAIDDLAVFPDGRSLLFVARAEDGRPWLWEVSREGGLPRKVAPGVLAAITSGGLEIVAIQPLESGDRRLAVLGRDGTLERSLHTFRDSLIPVSLMLEEGDRSVIAVVTDGIQRSQLLRIAIADGGTEVLSEVAGVASPGVTRDRKSGAVIWPIRTQVRGEAALAVTTLGSASCRVVYPGPGRASYPSMDRSGNILAFQLTETDGELVELAVHPDGGPPVTAIGILPGSRGASQPRVGPNPRTLLFQSAVGIIELMHRDSGATRPVLSTGLSQFNPAWSPDGRRIVCGCLTGGRSDLWLVAADGGAPERLTEDSGNDFQPVWYPDGRHILFISDREGTEDLHVLTLRDGSVRRLGFDGAANPAVSSDGHFVAYVVGATGSSPRLRLARLSADLTTLETVWDRPVTVNRWAGAKPRFSPDARWLAFDQPRPGGGADIWALPVAEGGSARAIRLTALPFPASLTGWFDWGPDWRIVAAVARQTNRICILHDADRWLREAR